MGVDPGLRYTGWAVLYEEGSSIMHMGSGVIAVSADEQLPIRLNRIYMSMKAVVQEFNPEICGIEKVYVNANNASSLLLAQARGAALAGLSETAVVEYQAKTIKKVVTGSGVADKAQVERMIKILLPNVDILQKDQSDAVAIALCCMYDRENLFGKL